MAGNPFDKFDQAAPAGFTPLGGPNPTYQKDIATLPLAVPAATANINQSNASAAASAAGAAHTNVQTDIDRRTAPAQIAKANAEAQKATLEAQQAAVAAANRPNPATAKIQQQLQTDDVLSQIGRARNLINGGWATGIPGSLLSHIPGTAATDLDSTLSTIGSNITQGVLGDLKSQSPTGASGFGALSDSEGRMLRDAVAPLAQNQSSDQLLDNLSRVERHYRNMLALKNNQDPRNPDVAQQYGIITPAQVPGAVLPGAPGGTPPSGPGGAGGAGGPPGPGPGDGGSPLSLSQSGYQTVADPTLQGVNAHVRGMIADGRQSSEIQGYLEGIKPGLGKSVASMLDAATAYRKQNPNTPLSQYRIDLQNTQVPLSPIRGVVNAAAQSAPGAAVLGAADALTGGYLDNMTSNPALARAGMTAVAQQHPGANLAGEVGGGLLTGYGLERGLGMAGLSAGARLPAADALYGSLYGSGSNDDNRLAGAAMGGATGLAGGAVGRKLTGMFGRSVAGVQDPGLQYLRDAGVPMTTGQVLGGAAKGMEDRLSGLPVVGDTINARRRAGLQAVQQRAFDEALSPIPGTTDGAIGEQGVARALGKVSDAYDQALGGVNVAVDQPYRQAMGQIQPAIAAIPRVGPELHAVLDQTVSPMFNGPNLSGQSMQAIDRGLQQVKSSYRNDPLFATHIAPAIDTVGDQVQGLFERQAPQTIPAYSAAKDAFRHVSTLEDAVLAGKNTGGEFTPAQLGTAAVANARRFGGKHLAASEGRPFFDLQRYAQNALPSKVPDSGTAGRLIIPGVAAGLGGGFGAGASDADHRKGNAALGALTLGALAAAPYSRGAQAALTRGLLAERPDALIKVGNSVAKNARIGGMFGNPLALQYYVAPGY